MAVQYVFTGANRTAGQFAAPATTTPADTGPNTNVTVIINSGVARGDVEKYLKRVLNYTSLHYTPTTGA